MSATVSATVAHASHLPASANRFGFGPAPSPSLLARLVSAFQLVVEVMHEARAEERKAYARSPFSAW
jgi:hypothetical protein